MWILVIDKRLDIVMSYFNSNFSIHIWISSWKVKTGTDLVWVCLAVCALSALQVALQWLSLHLQRKQSRRSTRLPRVPRSGGSHSDLDTGVTNHISTNPIEDNTNSSAIQPDAYELSILDSLSKSKNSKDHIEVGETTSRSENDRVKTSCELPTNFHGRHKNIVSNVSFFRKHGFSRCPHVIQTVIHLLQVTLTYCLMLLLMTFNFWICLALVLGAGLGYFLFTWTVGSQPNER